jgi:predicted RND superfamily exporter protein
MRLLYGVAPPDVQTAFISKDFTKANLIFPIANISLSERGKLLDQMKADLHPPAGVRATPAGLAVVGVALVHALQANRTQMTFLALVLVALWLLLVYRSLAKVLLTLVPVLVAVGLSAIVVYATGLELSPLTSVAGPLVIAVGTEFAVLIATRYVEERERGRTPADAVRTGIVRIGRAFVASGLTLVGGFAVIATSRFPLLRDFGIIVALNTLVALLVALVLLPPLLVWADGHPRIKSFSPGPGLLGIPTEPMVVTPGSETPTDVTV